MLSSVKSLPSNSNDEKMWPGVYGSEYTESNTDFTKFLYSLYEYPGPCAWQLNFLEMSSLSAFGFSLKNSTIFCFCFSIDIYFSERSVILKK